MDVVSSKRQNCRFSFLILSTWLNFSPGAYFQVCDEKYLSKKCPHRNVPQGLVVSVMIGQVFPMLPGSI